MIGSLVKNTDNYYIISPNQQIKIIRLLRVLSGKKESNDMIISKDGVNHKESLLALLNLDNLELLEIIGYINKNTSNLVEFSLFDGKVVLGSLALGHSLDWLNVLKINQILSELNQREYKVKILDVIDSTNNYILNNLDNIENKTCIIAEWQTNGRGRGNKNWLMRIATDFTLSVLYIVPLAVEVKLLPLIIAVGLIRLFKQFGLVAKIKWPNDIYVVTNGLIYSKNKICGILVESKVIGEHRCLVVGVGVDNVLSIDRSLFLCHLLNNIDNVIREYVEYGFGIIRQEWLDNCLHYNELVSIYYGDSLVDSGDHVDLTEAGILVISNGKSNNNFKHYDLSKFSLRCDSMILSNIKSIS